MSKSSLLIQNIQLLDKAYPHLTKAADILIEGTRIKDIGVKLDAPEAQRIDGKGMIAMPGLINTHIHLWQAGLHGVAGNWSLFDYFDKMLDSLGSQFSPEDMYVANLFGAIEQLDAGVTTVLDWCNNINTREHAERAVAGLEASGIRAIFAYGPPGIDAEKWWFNSSEKHPHDAVEFLKNRFGNKDDLIRLALALRGPDSTQDEVLFSDIRLAKELDVLATMHVGVRSAKFGVKKIYEEGLLSKNINFVHGNNLSAEEYKLIVDQGASLSVTPEVEMQMGMGFPATGNILAAGGHPILGTDIASNIGGELFTQLRFALQTERALANQRVIDSGELVKTLSLSYKHGLDWLTVNAARALHLDNVGLLAAGMKADLILIDTSALNLWPVHNPYEAILFYANRQNVDTVIVNGKILKRAGKMLFKDLENLKQQILESSSRILHAAKIL